MLNAKIDTHKMTNTTHVEILYKHPLYMLQQTYHTKRIPVALSNHRKQSHSINAQKLRISTRQSNNIITH